MSYWKLAANAAWGGLYATFHLACLVLLLNPPAPGRSPAMDLAQALASLAPIYLPAIALGLTTSFVFVRFFAVRRLSARWRSLKAIVWFTTAALSLCASVYAFNAWTIADLLPPEARGVLRTGAALMAACFVLACGLASLAQMRDREPARRLRIFAAGVLMLPLLFVAGQALSRSAVTPPFSRPGDEPPLPDPSMGPAQGGGRLVLVAIDAASMDHLLPLVAAGELPWFDRMMRKGASSRLDTLRPCLPEVAWRALLTGRPAWTPGRRATGSYALPLGPRGLDLLPRGMGMGWLRDNGYGHSGPAPEGAAGEDSLWHMARHAGLSTALAGWGSASAPPVGSDRIESRILRILGEPEGTADASRRNRDLDVLRAAVAIDLAARDESLAAQAGGPRFLAVRFRGLAEVARRYLRHHSPEEFGQPPARAHGPLDHVLAGYYEFLDEILGEHLAAAGEDAFVMAVSAHGVEPLPVVDRVAAWVGALRVPPDVSGSWRRGPDGIFLLHGPGVQAGARPEEVDLLDIAPTAVYLLGLPIESRMRGGLLRQVLKPDFLEDHPVFVVPSRGGFSL